MSRPRTRRSRARAPRAPADHSRWLLASLFGLGLVLSSALSRPAAGDEPLVETGEEPLVVTAEELAEAVNAARVSAYGVADLIDAIGDLDELPGTADPAEQVRRAEAIAAATRTLEARTEELARLTQRLEHMGNALAAQP